MDHTNQGVSSDIDFLYRLRHSLAHILAAAVLEIRPQAKLGFGPPIDYGFYYDFDFGDQPITLEDLPDIEKRMQTIIKRKEPFIQLTRSPEEALAWAQAHQQPYKYEHIQELIAQGKTLSFFRHGNFEDLCEGPHLDHTGEVPRGCFCLDTIAGSYWRGDENRPMLTRIYGLAFLTPAELKAYIEKRELAKQRDHRRLGTQLDLFSLSDNIGGGLVLWHPRGAWIRNTIETFWKEEHFRHGYQLLYTPHIGLANLWQTSGHLDFYKENMYAPIQIEDREFFIKPMNCPFHIEVYLKDQHSYRELPKRWAELGTVYRYERSGVLNGLLRVRGFTQDDAHIICTPEQIENEIVEVLRFCLKILRTFGFDSFKVYLATRPEKAVGDPHRWEQATNSLKQAVHELHLDCEVDEGGGAFYGPKIDLKIRDALDREWQCSTIQFDFNLPERFNLTYIGEDGQRHRPYMVHRALLGSIERFFALLVEHYGGAFPTWLAPTQVYIVPVGEHVFDYAQQISQILKGELFQVEVDFSSDSFKKKIRTAITSKTPNIWIVGGNEAQRQTVTWRRYVTGDVQREFSLTRALEILRELRTTRALDNVPSFSFPES